MLPAFLNTSLYRWMAKQNLTPCMNENLRETKDVFSYPQETLSHGKQYFNPVGEGHCIMQRIQRKAQGTRVQPMLGLPKILKRRTQQNVLPQSPRNPRMQVRQRTVRSINLTYPRSCSPSMGSPTTHAREVSANEMHAICLILSEHGFAGIHIVESLCKMKNST